MPTSAAPSPKEGLPTLAWRAALTCAFGLVVLIGLGRLWRAALLATPLTLGDRSILEQLVTAGAHSSLAWVLAGLSALPLAAAFHVAVLALVPRRKTTLGSIARLNVWIGIVALGAAGLGLAAWSNGALQSATLLPPPASVHRYLLVGAGTPLLLAYIAGLLASFFGVLQLAYLAPRLGSSAFAAYAGLGAVALAILGLQSIVSPIYPDTKIPPPPEIGALHENPSEVNPDTELWLRQYLVTDSEAPFDCLGVWRDRACQIDPDDAGEHVALPQLVGVDARGFIVDLSDEAPRSVQPAAILELPCRADLFRVYSLPRVHFKEWQLLDELPRWSPPGDWVVLKADWGLSNQLVLWTLEMLERRGVRRVSFAGEPGRRRPQPKPLRLRVLELDRNAPPLGQWLGALTPYGPSVAPETCSTLPALPNFGQPLSDFDGYAMPRQPTPEELAAIPEGEFRFSKAMIPPRVQAYSAGLASEGPGYYQQLLRMLDFAQRNGAEEVLLLEGSVPED